MITQTKTIILIVLVLLVALYASSKTLYQKQSCHKRPTNLKSLLGSEEPYRSVANTNESAFKFNGCRATRLWGLFRHGTRLPNVKTIEGAPALYTLRDAIVEKYSAGNGSLCAPDVSLLKDWKVTFGKDNAMDLVKEGAREHFDLGRRFKRRFPELFTKPYDESFYKFYITQETRTLDSASNFSTGLFGDEKKPQQNIESFVTAERNWASSQAKSAELTTGPEIKYEDPSISVHYLRFYKFCDKYIKEVKESPDSNYESDQFANGTEFQILMKNVSQRLGLNKTLTADDMLLMYAWCGFYSASNESSPSPWCAPFTENDLEVIQYFGDLEKYATHGYKYEITYKQACPLVKNVFDHFNSTAEAPSVKLHFAHSGTMLRFLARLGLYKESIPLKATDFTVNRQRKWRCSAIGPFAANVVFVLYDCGGEKKVLTLHNERTITLPGCPENQLCPLETFLEIYDDPINNCDFKEICSVESTQ